MLHDPRSIPRLRHAVNLPIDTRPDRFSPRESLAFFRAAQQSRPRNSRAFAFLRLAPCARGQKLGSRDSQDDIAVFLALRGQGSRAIPFRDLAPSTWRRASCRNLALMSKAGSGASLARFPRVSRSSSRCSLASRKKKPERT